MKKITPKLDKKLDRLIDILGIKFHKKDRMTGEVYAEPRAYLGGGYLTKTRTGVKAVIFRELFTEE